MTPTAVEIERRNRIKLAVAAYAYEFDSNSIMSDADFDSLSKTINTDTDTGHSVLDQFFRTEFHTDTGQWIHKHPELEKVKQLYLKFYKK